MQAGNARDCERRWLTCKCLLFVFIAQAYHAGAGLKAPSTILDIGCSTGLSTRWLQQEFPAADVTGMDLSPYFLSVAERAER